MNRNPRNLRLQLSAPGSPNGGTKVVEAPPNANASNAALSIIADKLRDFKEDVQASDLETIEEIGAGNGGVVSKVRHKSTGLIFARKNVQIEVNAEVRRRIVTELQLLKVCKSPYIVNCYGAFLHDGEICICLEYMEVGSLDRLIKYCPEGFSEAIIGQVALAVLRGLIYLYEEHRILHRDVKPSNILVNRAGELKLCDFGVSGQLNESVANSFVGTSSYMSPERIQGNVYSVRSDVWSLGLTLMELALGRFPFPPEGSAPLAIFELLNFIVHETIPKLPEGRFSADLCELTSKCIIKDHTQRPTPSDLIQHPFVIKAAKDTTVNLAQWASSFIDAKTPC